MSDHRTAPADAALKSSVRTCDRPIAMPMIGAGAAGVLMFAGMAWDAGGVTRLDSVGILIILIGICVGAIFGAALRVTRLARPVRRLWLMASWGFVCGTGATLLWGLFIFLCMWTTGSSFSEHNREPLSLRAAEEALETAAFAAVLGGAFLFPVGMAVGAIIGVVKNARRPVVEIRRNCELRQNEVLETMTNDSLPE